VAFKSGSTLSMTHKAPRKAFAHLNFWQAALFFAILAIGSVGIWWAVQRADLEMREELLTQTRLVAQAVNLDQIRRSAARNTTWPCRFTRRSKPSWCGSSRPTASAASFTSWAAT
jgi:hypothetical protein